jgi:hypothetical protein
VRVEKEAEAKAAADFQARKHKQEIMAPPPPLTEDECIVLIQVRYIIFYLLYFFLFQISIYTQVQMV